MRITRRQLRRLIRESGLNTTWNMGDRVVSLRDITEFLDSQQRPVNKMPAVDLKQMLQREITGIDPGRVRGADISVPIIVLVDRVSGCPVVVLDGNHRMTKAIVMDTIIPFRVLYSDEYDKLFGT